MSKAKKYWTLFFSTLTISAFTFGGGYVIVSFLKKRFVDELHWLEEDDMLNLAAIAQSAPGAVAVNAAILVGSRVAGVPGMFIAILGTIIPPFVIISVLSVCYSAFQDNPLVSAVLKGMQAGIAAVIADVTVNLARNTYKESGWLNVLVMVLAFCATWFLKVNVVYIILFCALYGITRTLLGRRKAAKK